MDDNLVLNSFPGIENRNGFCADPSGTFALFFDHAKKSFVQINLTSGQQTLIKTEKTKIKANAKFGSNHLAVLRSAKLFIYSLFSDVAANRLFIVSFYFNEDNISIIEEHYIGIDGAKNLHVYFEQDEKGKVFCLSYFRKESNTIFDVTQMNIDEHGKIVSKIIAQNRSLKGVWLRPFIHKGGCCWIEWHDPKLPKLLKVPFNKNQVEEIKIRYEIGAIPLGVTVHCTPHIIGELIFYYAYHKKDNFGILLKLELSDRAGQTCFKKLPIAMNGHIIIRYPELKHTDTGLLCLHGVCCADNCEDKAHLYIVNINEELKQRRPLPLTVQKLHNVYNFTSTRRVVPGVQGTNLFCFCVHPDDSTGYIFDPAKNSFVVIDRNHRERTLTLLNRKPSNSISKNVALCDIRCIKNNLQILFLAIVLERDTKKYFSVLFELKHEVGFAIAIEEYYIGIEEINSMSLTCIVNDANGAFYFIEYWENKNAKQTVFHVAKLEVNQKPDISFIVLACNRTIDHLCILPFVDSNCIIFFLRGSELSVTVSLNLINPQEKCCYSVIAPDCFNIVRNHATYPPSGISSVFFWDTSAVYYYIIRNEDKIGEFWALDFCSKNWSKCYELFTDTIGENDALFLTTTGRIFIHGNGQIKHIGSITEIEDNEKMLPSIQKFNEQLLTSLQNYNISVGSISWQLFDSTSNCFITLTGSRTCFKKTTNPFSTKRHDMKSIIDQSMNAMDQFYGQWWSSSREETIFIPACHDVFKNSYIGSTDTGATCFNEKAFEKKKPLYRGQKAESDVLMAFAKLNIGGVFISGFNADEFVKGKTFTKFFENFVMLPMEIDAIFLHPLIGIFVFEIKAKKEGKTIKSAKSHARQQLLKIEEKLPVIFQYVCNVKCIVPMYFAICFPNAEMEACVEDSLRENYFLIDKHCIQDQNKMIAILRKIMNYIPENEIELNSFKQFTAAVAGYRSLDFFSAGHNALAVHKMIDTQIFLNSNEGSGQDEIFLTNEQLSILGCDDQHQIISGPPGTGKTLILLKKVLAAAQTEKKGAIFVLTIRSTLVLKFQKFFERYQNSIIRFPVVSLSFKTIKSCNENDDIFFDEHYLSGLNISVLLERLNASGQTLIVTTGLFYPLQVLNVKEWIIKNNLSGYRHFQMDTVIRSTKQIFNEWKENYHEKNYPLHFGHNINGPNVKREKLNNTNEILNRTLEIIRSLFFTNNDSEDEATNKLSLGSLCIITDKESSCSLIKKFLKSNKIPCGLMEEQIFNQKIAAVTKHGSTGSHEWPIVIVISMIDIAYSDQFFLVASSRCIAKLIVIERDMPNFMKKIDEKIYPLFAAGSSIEYELFRKAVVSAERDNGETEDFIMNTDFVFQSIRWKALFTKVKEKKIFQKCVSLFDLWQRISKEPPLCRALLKEVFWLEYNLANVSDKPSALFTHITVGRFTEAEREEIWKIYLLLMKTLQEIVEKGNRDDYENDAATEGMLQISEELKNIDKEWEVVCYSIALLS